MSLSTQDIDFLRGLVAEQSGNVVAERQAYLLEQRLAPIATSTGLEDVSSLVNELRRSPNAKLKTRVAEAVTVNETSFFRDRHPFEALRTKIIPELIQRRETTKTLNIWSGACSSGQEPYTIAMTIREHFPVLNDWNVSILATDISEAMLAKSRSGEFTQLEVNRGLPAKKLIFFFDRNGTSWVAKPELRSLIRHQRLNLAQHWGYIGKFDIVFMRNVLIYFDQPTKQDIICRANRVLRKDGYFFLGSSETAIGLNIPFTREIVDETVCYRPK